MVVIGLTGAIFFAGPAGARVSSASGTCKALASIHVTPSSDASANGGKAKLSKVDKHLEQHGKHVPGGIKATLNNAAPLVNRLFQGGAAGTPKPGQAIAGRAATL